MIRKKIDSLELLVFSHPFAGWQLVKGTIEPGENPQMAALRELEEESGITSLKIQKFIANFDYTIKVMANEKGTDEVQRWHLYLLQDHELILKDSWEHQASGSKEEEGLIFKFFWIQLNGNYSSEFHPVFLRLST